MRPGRVIQVRREQRVASVFVMLIYASRDLLRLKLSDYGGDHDATRLHIHPRLVAVPHCYVAPPRLADQQCFASTLIGPSLPRKASKFNSAREVPQECAQNEVVVSRSMVPFRTFE